ncbi:MAG: sigma-54 dependent transcriptional regulator [bacterium]|nr:sigma-54 dependent transcriptional regulator [bacterium]
MITKARILVVDDDKYWCQCLSDLLLDEGYDVNIADDGIKAMELIDRGNFHLIIVDLKMPKMDGLEVLKSIKKQNPGIEVIILTGFGTVESAVEAMKVGAFDYLTKPCNIEETKLTVRNALHHRAIIEENRELHKRLEIVEGIESLIGKSPKMQKVYELIRNTANTDLTVLIEGESGVGKELVASAIHYKSIRAKGPFIRTNCATFTDTLLETELFGHTKGSFTGAIRDKKGLFEAADGGTLLLDEISELNKNVQAQLLRVIEKKEFIKVGDSNTTKVDTRIIVSTNKSLEECVKKGIFREDLFYRLNVYKIFLPPLRERKEDIPLFISHFLNKYNKVLGKAFKEVSRDTLNLLLSYNWPGNVREMENVIARVVASRDGIVLTPEDFSSCIPMLLNKSSSFKDAKKEVVDAFEKKYFTEILKNNKGNVSHSAEQSGMDRKNFSQKLKEYNINHKDFA